MDYGGRSGNAIEIILDASAPFFPKSVSSPSNDQSVDMESEYCSQNRDPSLETNLQASPEVCQSPAWIHPRGDIEQSSNKIPRGYSQGDSMLHNSNSNAIWRMFFKTKLCGKFRFGICPYVSNCNFAHGIEELRKPPTNWQEIITVHEGVGALEPREERHVAIPTSAVAGDGQRSYNGRHRKKFYPDDGVSDSAMSSFLQDDQLNDRETITICVLPAAGGGGQESDTNGVYQKLSNWKTRICNKWEMTGYCPFGSKCHFAHGVAELQRYGGGLINFEGNVASSAALDTKQQTGDTASLSASFPRADAYHGGVLLQRSAVSNPRLVQKPIHKWKGPGKINRIYGDWIDDIN